MDSTPGGSSRHIDAAKIASRAVALVSGDRAASHGDKRQNHENIAALWNAYLSIRREPAAPLSAVDVATLMALLKIARTQLGAHNMDDHIDHVGYAAIAGELAAGE